MGGGSGERVGEANSSRLATGDRRWRGSERQRGCLMVENGSGQGEQQGVDKLRV